MKLEKSRRHLVIWNILTVEIIDRAGRDPNGNVILGRLRGTLREGKFTLMPFMCVCSGSPS